MALFAIGDLHLSFAREKTMDKFGTLWYRHSERLIEQWKKVVQPEDTIALVGDISWALKLEEAKADLDVINGLPGKKICISGNHDYWWSSVSKVQKAYPQMTFLRNDSTMYGDIAICGTRGWICPNDQFFTEADAKIYRREIERLGRSLKDAMAKGAKEIVVLLHYPPTNEKKEWSGFLQLLQAYPVSHVIYGHLHGVSFWENSLQGKQYGIEFLLVSGDYLQFCPKKILED